MENYLPLGFPGGSDGKASACNVGDPGSIPGSGRSPGEGNGDALLPGKSHGRRNLIGYSPWGHKELDRIKRLHFHLQTQLKCFSWTRPDYTDNKPAQDCSYLEHFVHLDWIYKRKGLSVSK